jgi:hypothetical protein
MALGFKNFLVDAIFIVTDMGPQAALLDRVWRVAEIIIKCLLLSLDTSRLMIRL